jgi:hypothetical protein
MIRTLLVLGCVLAFLLALAGMYWGWSNRARRQASLPQLPDVPSDLGSPIAPELTGLYIGTTVATEWQNRIVVHTLGERADAVATCTEQGVLIDRQGSGPIFIPSAQLIDARLEAAVAGKVMGAGGLLVLRWAHGDLELDTALRADDKSLYPTWVNAIEGRALHG